MRTQQTCNINFECTFTRQFARATLAPAADLSLHVEAVHHVIAQRVQQPQVEFRRQPPCVLIQAAGKTGKQAGSRSEEKNENMHPVQQPQQASGSEAAATHPKQQQAAGNHCCNRQIRQDSC
jgi:hypothetical protein